VGAGVGAGEGLTACALGAWLGGGTDAAEHPVSTTEVRAKSEIRLFRLRDIVRTPVGLAQTCAQVESIIGL
jgi:hypothetical protein